MSAPNPPPSTRSNGPSTGVRRVLPPSDRASSFTSRKLGTNRIAKASTAAAAGLGAEAVSISPVHSWRVEQLEHRDRDDPGEQRDHLVHEPAHEADGGAADQQQEDEDVERGHQCAR